MPSKLKKKAADLAKELKLEIKRLESEVAVKKGLLDTLSNIEGRLGGIKRKGHYTTAAKMPANGRRKRGGKTGRRKSKNRDIILEAAKKLKGKFTLARLTETIHKSHPKFGGKYPAGAIIAVIKTTHEIKKVKRGVYSLKG